MTLQYLEMEQNELGDIAATSIRTILEFNTSLLTLNVMNNNFTNDGAADIAAGLKKNVTLKEIRLAGNHAITKKGRRLVKNACKGKEVKANWSIFA